MDLTLLTIGAEILKGRTLNSNAQYISTALYAAGFGVREVLCVGDSEAEILRAIEEAFRITPVVIATGGLGPTRDDVTKTAACRFFNRRLVRDDKLMAHLENLFQRLGYECFPERSRGQAEVPEGATVFPNRRGTAAGLLIEDSDRLLFLLPGVPVEMRSLIDEEIVPYLRGRFAAGSLGAEIVRTVGLGESVLAERIEQGLDERGRELLSYYPHGGLVDVVISAPPGSDEPGAAELDRVADHVASTVPEYVYCRDNRDLFQVVGDLLAERGQTVAFAESCTGGWLSKSFTDTSGASRYVLGGVVSYSNALKSGLLGVPTELIESHGAVSEPVCRAMAEGLGRSSGADYTVSVTGIAGPEGGTEAKPVGTVFIGIRGPGGNECRHFAFTGDRAQVRRRSVIKAAELLFRALNARKK